MKASGEKLSSHKIDKTAAGGYGGGGGSRKGQGKKKQASGGYGGSGSSSDLCRMSCPNAPLGSRGRMTVSTPLMISD